MKNDFDHPPGYYAAFCKFEDFLKSQSAISRDFRQETSLMAGYITETVFVELEKECAASAILRAQLNAVRLVLKIHADDPEKALEEITKNVRN